MFVNNQLQNINDFDTSLDIDLIIDEILKYPQFNHFTKIQILQQLIIDTSYQLPKLCIIFLYHYFYNYKNDYINNIGDILFRLTKHALNKHQYITDVIAIYGYCLIMVDNNKQKYFLFKNNEIIPFEYQIKLILISLHKMYYMVSFSKQQRHKIIIPEIILSIFKFYILDLNFTVKNQRLFVNILVDILNHYFTVLQQAYIQNSIKSMRPWEIFFDFIFSNWHLLYNRHKRFFKMHGKQIIKFCYCTQDLYYCTISNSEKIFLNLFDELK